MRARLALIGLLFALAGVAWWSTVDRMRGMDNGPGTALGTLGLVRGRVGGDDGGNDVSVGLADGRALRQDERAANARLPRSCSSAVTSLIWAGAGVIAFGISDGGAPGCSGTELAWHHGGRWLAGGILVGSRRATS